MSNRNSHITYSLEDIEKYLKGMMSAAEMHELERAALQDPFLSDAIEGYRHTSMQTAHTHLREIEQELLHNKEEAKKVPLPFFTTVKWWRMAAAVLLIATISTVTWKLTRTNNKQDTVAVNKKVVTPNKDSTATALIEKNNNSKSEIASIDKPSRSSSIEKSIAVNRHRDFQKTLTAELNRADEKAIASSDIQSHKNLKQDYVAAVRSGRQDTTLPSSYLADKEIASNTEVFNRNIVQDPFAKNNMTLQGKVAGVPLSKSKIKKDSEKFYIRGSNNDSTKKPLYVIDGIVYESNPPDIPPSIIKSLDILKGANATALYGAKASNGVIVISTKLKMKPLQGQVVNQNGVGIAGATITVKSNKQNLTTDAHGNFTVNSLDDSALASVNSVGYQPSQSIVKTNEQNRIVLHDNNNSLKEEVVIGYSTNKRKLFTGSISSTVSHNLISNTEMPLPDGGWNKFKDYLASKLSDGTNYTVHGTVEFEFLVDKARKAKHIRILQSPDTRKNVQLMKAVKKGPKWTVKGGNKKQKVSFSF